MRSLSGPCPSPLFSKACLATVFSLMFCVQAFGQNFGQFVHPGISHKESDLQRMKLQAEAGIEPWATAMQVLMDHPRASFDFPVGVLGADVDPSFRTEFSGASDNFMVNDGGTAYLNALMWYFTEDPRHAEKCIEIFNAYKGMRRNTQIPLFSGRIIRMIEAAELIKSTYDGWDPSEMQEFEDMLVYPGYSSTTVPADAIDDDDISFYWKVYNGDPSRIGNQGLLAARLMMAMGIFMDNEKMYDRAVRMLRGEANRSDDLVYQSGPPIVGDQVELECDEFYEQYDLDGFRNRIQNYGYNEVIEYYIHENGQSQEADRDQAHSIAGISSICGMGEIAWNQGDDIYGTQDNRPLLGLEYHTRYNLSNFATFADQPQPWEPTVESGEFFQRALRNGRRFALKINPGVNCNQDGTTRGNNLLDPVFEMPLAHYRDRIGLPSEDYKWIQRGHDYQFSRIGVEGITNTLAFPVYGSLFYRRVSPGDPISGFDDDGVPQFAMHMLPGSIEAENFDYFPINGQGRTYSDTTSGNQGGDYRFDSNVDIQKNVNGVTAIAFSEDGEFMTYTVSVPETGTYNIRARVSSRFDGGSIRFSFDGVDQTGVVAVPNTGSFRTYTTLTVAEDVLLTRGVQQVKIDMLGNSFNLDTFTVDTFNIDAVEVNSGESQRSSIESVNVVFDGEVDLADGAVNVVQRSTQTGETFEVVATSVSQEFANGQTTATIEFDSHVRNDDNALVDGNYQLTLTADLVTQDGVPMSEDFVFGDVETDQFYSFYGDADGDRDVDNVDFSFFIQTYFKQLGNATFNSAMDYDADDDVDNVDFSFFLGRYFKTMSF